LGVDVKVKGQVGVTLNYDFTQRVKFSKEFFETSNYNINLVNTVGSGAVDVSLFWGVNTKAIDLKATLKATGQLQEIISSLDANGVCGDRAIIGKKPSFKLSVGLAGSLSKDASLAVDVPIFEKDIKVQNAERELTEIEKQCVWPEVEITQKEIDEMVIFDGGVKNKTTLIMKNKSSLSARIEVSTDSTFIPSSEKVVIIPPLSSAEVTLEPNHPKVMLLGDGYNSVRVNFVTSFYNGLGQHQKVIKESIRTTYSVDKKDQKIIFVPVYKMYIEEYQDGIARIDKIELNVHQLTNRVASNQYNFKRMIIDSIKHKMIEGIIFNSAFNGRQDWHNEISIDDIQINEDLIRFTLMVPDQINGGYIKKELERIGEDIYLDWVGRVYSNGYNPRIDMYAVIEYSALKNSLVNNYPDWYLFGQTEYGNFPHDPFFRYEGDTRVSVERELEVDFIDRHHYLDLTSECPHPYNAELPNLIRKYKEKISVNSEPEYYWNHIIKFANDARGGIPNEGLFYELSLNPDTGGSACKTDVQCQYELLLVDEYWKSLNVGRRWYFKGNTDLNGTLDSSFEANGKTCSIKGSIRYGL
jgi:hypothetical protein